MTFHPSRYAALQSYLTIVLCRDTKLHGGHAHETAPPSQMNTETLVQTIGFSQLSREQQLLIRANLIRRHRFIFARRRASALKGQIKKPEGKPTDLVYPPSMEAIGQGTEAKSSTSDKEKSDKARIAEAKHTTPSVALHSEFTASTAATAVLEGLKHEKWTAATDQLAERALSTQISSTTAAVRYPRPPKVNPGSQTFKCPCCQETLPARTARTPRVWK